MKIKEQETRLTLQEHDDDDDDDDERKFDNFTRATCISYKFTLSECTKYKLHV